MPGQPPASLHDKRTAELSGAPVIARGGRRRGGLQDCRCGALTEAGRPPPGLLLVPACVRVNPVDGRGVYISVQHLSHHLHGTMPDMSHRGRVLAGGGREGREGYSSSLRATGECVGTNLLTVLIF